MPEEIKLLCKWIVENSNRQLSDTQKEIIKQAIDKSETLGDLLSLAASVAVIDM